MITMRGKYLTLPALVPALVLILTACGGLSAARNARNNAGETAENNNYPAITMEQIVAANDVDTLLSHYDSFLTRAVISAEYDEPFSWETYVEKDFVYVPYQTELADLYPGELVAYLSDRNLGAGYFIADGNGGFVFSAAFPAMPAGNFTQSVPEDYSIIDPDLTRLETITDISEQDGITTVSTELSGSTVQYTLDSDTLEIISTEETSMVGDERTVIVLNISHSAERPELAVRMLSDMRECAETPEVPATLTVIYDPGADNQESYSRAVDQKFQISPIVKEGYELCYDADGEEPFLDYGVSLADGDVILYAIPY